MDKTALMSGRDRSELFEAAAAKRGLHPAVMEKDFWVCWILQKLFASPAHGPHLVFKGGTSLSKVYGLIDRFSEDIDLVLNWTLLGYGVPGRDPWEEQPSNTQRNRLNAEINEAAAQYLANVFSPSLAHLLAPVPGMEATVSDREELSINIRYPAAFNLAALRPEIRLEIGPLASWIPSSRQTIRPYAAESYPRLFDNPECTVMTILAERTFWEKATILHQQAHQPRGIPPHYSRHYYDLYRMADSPVRQTALREMQLLADVVRFKQIFYRCPWARYEDAKPGTIRLLPSTKGNKELIADYRLMRPMFFREPPAWEAILAGLAQLETEINALESGACKSSPGADRMHETSRDATRS